MSLNKKALAAAVVGALVAGNAYAVNITTATSPAIFAREIVTPRTLTTNPTAGVDQADLSWNVGYNFSEDEVRYARIECSSNLQFSANSTVTLTEATAGNSPAASIGAINGLGTNALTFSVTSQDASNLIVAADFFTVQGNHTVTNTSDVTCTAALYDNPSNAQTGGVVGRIPTSVTTGTYIRFADSYNFTSASVTATADVVTDYLSFLAAGDTTAATAELASWTYGLVDPDGAGPQTATLDIDGTAITLADLMATGANGTRVVVTGDFSFAAANGVFLSSGGNCAASFMTATVNAAETTATFLVGATALPAGTTLCLTRDGTTAIPVVDYTAQLIAVSANPLLYTVTNRGPFPSGSIVRNGTELQAPLVQLPTGYLSRIQLTNTGGIARTFRVRVIGEGGNVISTNAANMTGTVPANGTTFFELNSIITGFSTSPRAAVIVTVDAPTNQIQGLYQIVKPETGALSNHVMVRPGTN